MDPDACRNCGHSGKHVVFLDHRCAIHERDDAERDKLQADAALERARDLCESSLGLMKRQMQELEDANEAIDALAAALAAAEDRRERVRRDLGTHGDVCLTARSNLEAAEEMAIAAAGRYFEAGRAVAALEEKEQQQQQQQQLSEPSSGVRDPMEEDEEEAGGRVEEDARRWQRSNERFCKWLRQSEAQRQIMKSSWTKLRVAERLASEGVDDEQVARQNRVQEWAEARRRSDVPPEEDATFNTEGGESEPPAPVVPVPPTPAATRSGVIRKPAPIKTTRGRSGGRGAAAAAAQPVTAPPSPTKTTTTTTGRPLRTARRLESQTRSEPARPTTATRAKKEPVTANQKAAAAAAAKTTGRTTRAARTAKTGAAEAAAVAAAAGASAGSGTSGRPQRVTRRKSRVQPYPQPQAQPRWK
ncbi:UbiD family decarboxylase [Colletotrichum karsti]|uniref:UbiD family decarboxylase n=1 Tax=Colletotrichum karsti TaxID=1095194 RepID=A0A9P6LM30_9PEZI|nr:UbiD family decarboxylase [Colletotrichum karsti]KAF9878413.1 UbiD family decarboxylase [Colletotrichum karsti]